MTTSRRKLLQALGLGGVGLVTGFGVKEILADDMIASERDRLRQLVPDGVDFDDFQHRISRSDRGVQSPEMCDLGNPPAKSPLVKVGPDACVADQLEMWEHPDMDLIEATMRLKGGYPGYFGHFDCGEVQAYRGDQLKIHYTISSDDSERELVLYRVYDVAKQIICIGTSLQGPVVRDELTPNGHRLATINEMVPNEKESLEGNMDVYRDTPSAGNGMI